MVLCQLIDEVEGRRKGKRKRKKAKTKFLTVVMWLIAAIFAPAFIQFGMSLYRDPAVPQLIKITYEDLKRRATSYLSNSPYQPPEDDPQPSERRTKKRR
eukprot:CAMPEP_0119474400 /NCGR_PEP_ID=MMETSP1344-20130328/5663_1 /TAXON_ID=236787 /ORGANISM="Florenciella parvula, Strain CCMP2471" /LENGTH=98 /DNA_ID=CAMNT_0007507679 /DNA_START=244 /DNA_END=540 /DNA_ORIENTATION=-